MPYGVPLTEKERNARHMSLYGEPAPPDRKGLGMYGPRVGQETNGLTTAMLIGIGFAIGGAVGALAAWMYAKR